MFDIDTRIFTVGDRVKCWFKNRWWTGTISEIIPRPTQVAKSILTTYIGDNKDIKIISDDGDYVTTVYHRLSHIRVKTDKNLPYDKKGIKFLQIHSACRHLILFESDPIPTNPPQPGPFPIETV